MRKRPPAAASANCTNVKQFQFSALKRATEEKVSVSGNPRLVLFSFLLLLTLVSDPDHVLWINLADSDLTATFCKSLLNLQTTCLTTVISFSSLHFTFPLSSSKPLKITLDLHYFSTCAEHWLVSELF